MEDFKVVAGGILLLVVAVYVIRTRIAENSALPRSPERAGGVQSAGNPFGGRAVGDMKPREDYILARTQEMGEDEFPDYESEWKVSGFDHFTDFTLALFEPLNPEVEKELGYGKFKFIVSFEASMGPPRIVAVYALDDEDNRWHFLSVAPLEDIPLPEVLEI